MAFTYTKAQQDAILNTGKNLLVSAGAGSGKTAVLTERVIHKLKEGVDIQSLVILTFTNKAAAEMRERIRKAIVKGVADQPHLKKALERLDAAHIRTFDSYAFFLLKKYGYLMDISSDVTIADQAMLSMKKDEIVTEVLEDAFARGEEGFLDYARTFSSKSDYILKTHIQYFYEALSLHYDKTRFYESLKEDFFNDERFEAMFDEFERFIFDLILLLKKKADAFASLSLCEEASAVRDSIVQALEPLFEAQNYDDVFEKIEEGVQLPDLRSVSRKLKDTPYEEEKDLLSQYRTAIQDFINKRIAQYVDRDKAAHKRAFLSTYPHVAEIVKLLKDFDQRLYAFELEEETFDYANVARIALDILSGHPEILASLKENIHEVMVDEYQDTNAMQETFVEMITDHNLYMVGDVKQSIYRFRDADPTIFAEKYRRYQTEGGGEVVPLTDNFRSRKEVLADINRVFEGVMDRRIGGIDYDEDQALSFGNKTYDEHVDEKTPYGLTLAVYDKKAGEESLGKNYQETSELYFIARDIKRRVESGEKVFEDGELRNIRYGDFAILSEKTTSYDRFVEVFEDVGVPLSVHKNPTFLAHEEIAVLRQLLVLLVALNDNEIYEKRFKHAFLSVMRSFVFAFDDDAIARQTLSFPRYRPNNRKQFQAVLHDAFAPVFTQLFALADDALTLPLEDILHRTLSELSFVERLVRIEGTEHAKLRIDSLMRFAKDRGEAGETLRDFLQYFDSLKEAGEDRELQIQSAFDKESVHLLTMHKSKGLQFPFVYLPHLYKRFNFSSMRSVEFDKRFSFIVPHFEEGLDQNFLFHLKRVSEKEADISERLRLLYVAMSRAKEGIVAPLGIDEEKDETHPADGKIELFVRREYSSFADVFTSLLPRLQHATTSIDIADYGVLDDEASKKKPALQAKKAPKTYAHPPKPPLEKESRSFSEGTADLLDRKTLESIEAGNEFHDLLESLDLENNPLSQVERLHVDETTRERLKAFVEHPFFQSLDLKRAYKEYPFAFEEDGVETTGYIDLLLETEDKFIIVDYKLKDIEKDGYKRQIEGYVSVLEPISDKPVEGYLYSIVEARFLKVL